MSVTGADYPAGETISSRNGEERSRNGFPIGSRNAGLEGMTVRELEAREELLSRLLSGGASEGERARRRRVYVSAKRGEACGKCGEPLAPEGKAYRTRLIGGPSSFWLSLVCEGCAPGYMKRGDSLGCRRTLEAACDGCGRTVVYELTGRDFYRAYVFCCERCRWTHYNGRRNRSNALDREKACEGCGETFTATRRDAKTCSAACKQKAYRLRKKGAA